MRRWPIEAVRTRGPIKLPRGECFSLDGNAARASSAAGIRP
jgi:hypothetical protein